MIDLYVFIYPSMALHPNGMAMRTDFNPIYTFCYLTRQPLNPSRKRCTPLLTRLRIWLKEDHIKSHRSALKNSIYLFTLLPHYWRWTHNCARNLRDDRKTKSRREQYFRLPPSLPPSLMFRRRWEGNAVCTQVIDRQDRDSPIREEMPWLVRNESEAAYSQTKEIWLSICLMDIYIQKEAVESNTQHL